MTMTTVPDGWSPDRLTAFNNLCNACEAYMIYDNALTKLGVNDSVLLQRRADVGNLILNVLGPIFRNL